MDLAAAATYFDDQPVYDAYSGVLLYEGQPDLYDLSKSDSAAGFRRTISAEGLYSPSRGCIQFGGSVFLMGNITRDYFKGSNHRTYSLLHPADGLVDFGNAVSFVGGTPVPNQAYSGESWLKDRKFEQEGSELRPEYTHFMHPSETVARGMLLKDAAGSYFRLQAVSRQTGGLLALTAFDLGADALKTVNFYSSGVYDPVTDSSSVSAPIAVTAVVEFFRANYHFPNNAAVKYERADKVVTVAQADIADPKPGDTAVVDSITYRMLERQDDSQGCWELHMRPEV